MQQIRSRRNQVTQSRSKTEGRPIKGSRRAKTYVSVWEVPIWNSIHLLSAIARDSVPRPTHKLGFLGLFGEKVDSIDWARKEISICTALLDEARQLVHSADDEDSRKGEALLAHGIGGGWNNEKQDVRHDDDASDEFTSSKEQTEETKAGGGPSTRPELVHQLSHVSHEASGLPKKAVNQATILGRQAVSQATSLLSKKGNKEYPPLNSAFITFHKQIAAHMAMQSLIHHEPYRMSELFPCP